MWHIQTTSSRCGNLTPIAPSYHNPILLKCDRAKRAEWTSEFITLKAGMADFALRDTKQHRAGADSPLLGHLATTINFSCYLLFRTQHRG